MDQIKCLPASGLITLTELQKFLGLKNKQHFRQLLKDKGIKSVEMGAKNALIRIEDLR